MKELLETLDGWTAEGVGAGRAVVVRTFGSAPRPEGAVLIRADDGRIAGSVSGGCVEGAAATEIERARADGHSRVIRYGISDEEAWDVGPGLRRHDRRAGRAGGPRRGASTAARDRGRAVRHDPPRRRAAGDVRAHEPGEGSAPEPPIVVSRRTARSTAARARRRTTRRSRTAGRGRPAARARRGR